MLNQQHDEETQMSKAPIQTNSVRVIRKPAALRKRGVEDIDSLLAILERENRTRKRASRILPAFAVLYTLFIFALMFMLWRLTGKFNGAFFSFFGVMGVMGALAVSENYKQAAHKLAKLNDIRAVGAWAEALEVPDREIREMARKALTGLLPAVRASDADRFNAEQRLCLAAHLLRAAREEEVDFILLLLRTLEQVGDGSAIPYVQKLQGEGIAVKETRICEEAEACLSVLAMRRDQEQNQQTLLRGSHVLPDAPETLLHPVLEVSDGNPAQLLRPSTPERASE